MPRFCQGSGQAVFFWLATAADRVSGILTGSGRDAVPGVRICGRDGAAGTHGPRIPTVRCRACGKQFNERSAGQLNRTQYPSDVIALVVLWRLRYKLSLRDLAEMFLTRGFIFTYKAVRAKRYGSGNTGFGGGLASETKRQSWSQLVC
jgi:hypothetical protein